MSSLIISDIDGVLADCAHRLHYLDEKNYGAFYGVEMANDNKIEAGAALVKALYHRMESLDLILLTGRPERTRRITELWLGNSLPCCDPDTRHLLMRQDGDHRKSEVVKVELLQDILRPPKQSSRRKSKRGIHEYDRVFFIDDDPKNVLAVCEAYPEVVGITFGASRLKEAKC